MLEQREQTHGCFSDTAVASQAIKEVFFRYSNGRLTPVMCEALDMIASKLSRVICGDPDTADHWADIGGYAMLVYEDLRDE
ncbi:MAG: hypothetical protein AB7Q04_13015 [Steroidobacteraceae bacterium]